VLENARLRQEKVPGARRRKSLFSAGIGAGKGATALVPASALKKPEREVLRIASPRSVSTVGVFREWTALYLISEAPAFQRRRHFLIFQAWVLEPDERATSQTASGTAFPQELGCKIKQTAADSLYDLSWAQRRCSNQPPRADRCRPKPRRNYVERRKCNRIKSNLARSFKP
jgi:hypothetical protein